MATTCESHIVPILVQDECGGKRTNAKCVIDVSAYPELGLSANSSQEDINQALYTVVLAQKELIEDLQTQIDNLP
jgi:hypothetical protein